jgi:iron complex outermembrane receptor protein
VSGCRALLPLLLAVAGVPLLAQDKATDQRVEISAALLSDSDQRRRDPVARTVYGRDELDKYGDTSVSDVLKRLPGVNMQGGAPRLRGLGAGYTLLLVNGDPAPPGFSLDNLSPGQVERIELTRGPSADQSAQAVAGTLNIMLREAPRSRQRELSLRLGYQALRPTLSANGSWGDRLGEGARALSISVPVSVYQWRGQADSLSQRQTLDVAGDLQRLRVAGTDRYRGGGFNIAPRLSWKVGDQETLSWQTFAQRHRFHNSGEFVTDVLEGAPPVSVDDRFASGGHWQMLRSGLQWQQKWAGGARLELKGGFQASSSRSHNRTDGVDAGGAATLARDTDSHNVERSLTGGGKLSRPLGEAHTLAAGWDLERRSRREVRSIVENGHDLLPGYEGLPFEARLDRIALFVQDEWELAPRWSTYLGLRAERIATTGSGTDAPVHNTSQVVTPVWHLNHKLDAGGRDLLRASLTRSYKAPELGQLTNRPSISTLYPVSGPNPEIAPDRIGNPGLKPELATGLDLAFEKYLPQGGVLSIGGFHRRIDGLIRNRLVQQAVPWADAGVQRWVSQPVNLAHARSTGIELELKGRGDELWPAMAAASAWLKGLNLRASASVYRSTVNGIPGPDNRLEQQQPWSASAGFDQQLGRLAGAAPLTVGASLAWMPGYRTQQTPNQSVTLERVRTLDAYALWAIDAQTSLRLAAGNLLADPTRSLTELQPVSGALQSTDNSRSNRRSFSAGLSLKF